MRYFPALALLCSMLFFSCSSSREEIDVEKYVEGVSVQAENLARSLSGNGTLNATEVRLIRQNLGGNTHCFAVGINNEGTVVVAVRDTMVRPLVYFVNEPVDSVLGGSIIDRDRNISFYSHWAQQMAATDSRVWNNRNDFQTTESVAPRCKVFWHQVSPYNTLCRKPDNTVVQTGELVVGTAMALTVMRPSLTFLPDWNKISVSAPDSISICRIDTLIKFVADGLGVKYGMKDSLASPGAIPTFAFGLNVKSIVTSDGEGVRNILKESNSVGIVLNYGSEMLNYARSGIVDGCVSVRGGASFLHVMYGWEGKNTDKKEVFLLCSGKPEGKPLYSTTYYMLYND